MRIISNKEPPINIDVAKRHLRLGDDNNEDDTVSEKIAMAVSIAEDYTGKYIQAVEVEIDFFEKIQVKLPTPTYEVISVSGITGENLDYRIESIFEANNIVLSKINSGVVKCNIGYTKDTIPRSMMSAILLLLGTLYENESDIVVGRQVSELPITAFKILDKHRIKTL